MMHTRTQTHAGRFADAAAEELLTMHSFVTLLEHERSALGEGQADALPRLAAEKTTLAEVLSRCAGQRARLLELAGLSGTAAGVRQLLVADPDAQEIWRTLLAVAQHAAELNSGNSYLVNQRLAHVERAIDSISGPRTSLYSTSGVNSFGSAGSRSLAQG